MPNNNKADDQIISNDDQSETLPHLSVKKCANCEEVLTGAYCMACGQKDSNLLRPFWNLMEDTLGDLFSFDSRFFTTLFPLLVKPGYVTREFNRGRRARFVPPFRQYLVVSVIFFLLLVNVDFQIFDSSNIVINNSGAGSKSGDIITFDGAAGTDEKHEDEPNLDKYIPPEDRQIINEKDQSVSEILDKLTESLTVDQENKLKNASEADKKTVNTSINTIEGLKKIWKDPKLLNIIIADWIPKMMFLMLPLFALILKFTYILQKKFYIEHLVFSLHFHAFVFLLFSLMLLLYQFVPISREYLSYLIWYIPIYLFISLWFVYQQSAIKTFFKGAFISLIYVIFMSVGVITFLGYGLSRM